MLTSSSSRWTRIAATAGAAAAMTVMAVTMTTGPVRAATTGARDASPRASAMDCPTYPNCGPVPAAAVASVVCPDPKDCPAPGFAFGVVRRAASV